MMTTSTSQPRYLLDTNVVVHYIRGNDLGQRIEATYSLKSAQMAPLICAVTEGELRSLALQFGWGPDKRRKLDALLGRFVTVQLDLPGMYDAYATLDHQSRKAGVPMGKNDVWIAATAMVTRALLLTTDKDFEHLHETYLTLEYIDPAQHA